ncbi:hypothetical protein [Tautonia rosea]|uniref:hypothetical protein n=1 Tax=Tautonia rosea TaxID=2728037 RepID=UPI001472F2BF|nr:hypothetical protein [Tautonia rosea]
MSTVKRVVGLLVRIGGEQHTGWLPAGAAIPLPTPIRDVLIDIEVQFDGHGYLLCYQSRDGDVYGDTWHGTLSEAEQVAAECFGVEPSQWQDA